MTKVIAYLRVSTEKQADHGISLESQKKKVKQYADLYDLDLVEIIVDAGLSAKTLNRTGLQKALSMLKSNEATGLLVVKLDRLTRSVKDLGYLIEKYFDKKYSLFSVSENIDTRTAAGRLVLNILGSVSQWEREIIGERTSESMQHKIQKGQYIGGNIPFGFTLGADKVNLVENLHEQK